MNEELENVRKISTSFNPIETMNMNRMVANARAALSWTELSLQALAPYQSAIQGKQATHLDHHLTCISRAVGFVMENLVSMASNWELKRRDSILEKMRNKESRTTRRRLRNGPLFQEKLFQEEGVQEIHDKLLSKLRDEQLINGSRQAAQKRQASSPVPASSSDKRQRASQLSRGEGVRKW